MKLDKAVLTTKEKLALGTITRGLMNIARHFDRTKVILSKNQELDFICLSKSNVYGGNLPDGMYTFVSQSDFKRGNIEKRNTLVIGHSPSGAVTVEMHGRLDMQKHPFFTPIDFVGDDVIYVPISEYHLASLS